MPATQKRLHDLPERSPSPKAGHPHKVLHITTYVRLEAYLAAFAKGHFNLLILVGAGGLAKSRSVRAALGGRGCWIEGNATPFGMYVKLYRHRDEFVVIDDVDAVADFAVRRQVSRISTLSMPGKTIARTSVSGAP